MTFPACSAHLPESFGPRLGWVTLGWLLVGVVSGLQVFFAQPHLGLPLPTLILVQVGYALPWIPASLGVAEVARRYSLRDRRRWLPHATYHLLFAVLVVGATNLAQGGMRIAVGFGTPATYWPDVADGLLQWGHLAFVVYVALAVAFSRAPHPLHATTAPAPPPTPAAPYVATLTAQQGRRSFPIPVANLCWVEAANDYVQLHQENAAFLANYRMGWLEKNLDPALFARTHRSTLVNLQCVVAYEPLSHGDYELHLADGTRLKLTRTRREEVLRRLTHLTPTQ